MQYANRRRGVGVSVTLAFIVSMNIESGCRKIFLFLSELFLCSRSLGVCRPYMFLLFCFVVALLSYSLLKCSFTIIRFPSRILCIVFVPLLLASCHQNAFQKQVSMCAVVVAATKHINLLITSPSG